MFFKTYGLLLILLLLCGCATSSGKYIAHSFAHIDSYRYVLIEGEIDTSGMTAFTSRNVERDIKYSRYVEKSLAKYFQWKGFRVVSENSELLEGQDRILVCRYDGGWNTHIPGFSTELKMSLGLFDYSTNDQLFAAESKGVGSRVWDDIDLAVGEMTQDLTEYLAAAKNHSVPTPKIDHSPKPVVAVPNKDFTINSAEKRVALVVGNGSYASAPLENPVRDAEDIASSLGALGFDVIRVTNASAREMDTAMNTFYASLKQGDVGLFYYAGHGIQIDGHNYLVPVDATIDSESDAKYECMDAGRILGKMEDAGNAMNIVVLDACRNNPFARSFRSSSRGLARMDAPTGSIVAYSTAPGDVAADGTGRNGIYTKHLLKHMMTPGLDLNSVFIRTRMDVIQETEGKQVPWESSSLTGLFYFVDHDSGNAEKK